MVDLLTLQTIGILITATSVSIAAIYYSLTLRNANRTRQAQLFMQFYAVRSDKAWWDNVNELFYQEWEDYDDWNQKYGRGNKESWNSFLAIMSYFNSLGFLVRYGYIDLKEAGEILLEPMWSIWEKMKPLILVMRERFSSRAYKNFEYLYDETKKHSKQINHPFSLSQLLSKL
jgi:hypothetical protein